MFGSLGLPEILVILVLALLIFGPKRLPEVGRTIGKGLAEFRRATTDLKRSVNAELSLEDDERPSTSRRPSQSIEGVGRTMREASTSREVPETAPRSTEEPEKEKDSGEAAAPEGTTPRSAEGSDAGEAGSAATEDEPSEPVKAG